MFLSSLHSNSFSFGFGGDNSARRAAIEAELRHLPDFTGRDITVETAGACIVLEGYVDNERDSFRAFNLASDIAGADKVIFRVRQREFVAA